MILWKRSAIAVIALLFVAAVVPGQEARMVFAHQLPALDGSRLQAKLVEVTYAPGESSQQHSHPCPVVGYVLQGAVRMQVKGEPEAVYKAAQTFYEAPNGVHAISENASKKEPARFLAIFTCDHETPLSVPVPQSAAAPGK